MSTAFQATVSFTSESNAASGASPTRWPDWMQRLLRPMRPASGGAIDRSTGLYNRAGLFAAARDAIHRRAADAPVGMVVLEFTDLREVYQIYGSAVARKVVARIIRRLKVVQGSRGFTGRTGPSQFTVVLPGSTEENAMKQVQRALGNPARVEFDAGDSEIVLVPHLLVDSAEPGTPAQDLYREMSLELSRIQKNEMRRLHWLTSERERHSRPMKFH
ncbi:MAG TPA: diguanylate cyclase [Ramlibacter sp.]|jgi:GGDEF domain-containing protein|nr:diguanylate cyclase [Ramlibacter sp.]